MKINPNKKSLTQQELMRLFYYDPDTGKMYRIVSRNKPSFEEVTSHNNRGYLWVNIKRVVYLVHRLVYLYMTGEHSDFEIDHVDGDRMNNRWDNLRPVTAAEQTRNHGVRKDNTSGVRGIHKTVSKKRGKVTWIVRISHNNKRIHLGNFKNFEDAVEARKLAEQTFGYHPNHGERQSWQG